MADNFRSYSRFTALPPNIADYGATVEEIALQKGRPDKNPAVSPMPLTRTSRLRLFLRPRGSDELRLGHGSGPQENPYEGPRPTLVLTRLALAKLHSEILTDLEAQLSSQALPVEMRTRMADSCARVRSMRAYLMELQKMSESVYVRAVAASRG